MAGQVASMWRSASKACAESELGKDKNIGRLGCSHQLRLQRRRASNAARPKQTKAARRAGVVHVVSECGEGPLDAKLELSPARLASLDRKRRLGPK